MLNHHYYRKLLLIIDPNTIQAFSLGQPYWVGIDNRYRIVHLVFSTKSMEWYIVPRKLNFAILLRFSECVLFWLCNICTWSCNSIFPLLHFDSIRSIRSISYQVSSIDVSYQDSIKWSLAVYLPKALLQFLD